MRNILMAVVFQCGWFACVLSGARGAWLTAVLAASIVLVCNLWLTRQGLREKIRLIAWVTLVGFVVETINLMTGVFTLAVPSALPWLCPVWLLLLWTLFATLLQGPLAWLAGRYGLSALLGALFAAPNYFAGARLGAVTLHGNSIFSITLLAVLWALAMPLLVWLAGRGGPNQVSPTENGACTL